MYKHSFEKSPCSIGNCFTNKIQCAYLIESYLSRSGIFIFVRKTLVPHLIGNDLCTRLWLIGETTWNSTWFMTLSCVDLRWPGLFQIISRIQGKDITDEVCYVFGLIEERITDTQDGESTTTLY